MGQLLIASKSIFNILRISFSFHISNNIYLFSFQHSINVKCRRNITQTHAAIVVKYTLISEQNVFYLLVLTKVEKYANENEIYNFVRKSALYSLLGRHGRQRSMSVSRRQVRHTFRKFCCSFSIPSFPRLLLQGFVKKR